VIGMHALFSKVAVACSAALLLGTVGAGCGDDSPQAKKSVVKKKARRRSRGSARAAAKGGGAVELTRKIVEEDRPKLKERDFRPDLSGDENRDPFRSYVIRQPGRGRDRVSAQDATVRCEKKNYQAANYSLRALKLTGIVLRGTQSYALFRDSSTFGHLVRRGDCLGKEKAIVEAIGAGFVRLELVPETAPGGDVPEAQKRSISLYPEEYELETEEE